MKKENFIVYVLILLSIVSCQDFEDNRRILIKGKVSNISEFEQQNIQVIANIEDVFNDFSSLDDVIGRTVVEDNGEFEVVAPVPINRSVFVSLNSDFFDQNDSIYQFNVEVPNLAIENSNNLIDLQEIEIKQSAFLKINFLNESAEESTISWQLSNLKIPCDFIVNSDGLISTNESCFEPFPVSDQYTDLSASYETISIKNTTTTLVYSINGGAQQTLDIPLNNSFNEVSITY